VEIDAGIVMNERVKGIRDAKTKTRVRLDPVARREQIVAAAVSIITENGLTFNTRDLAERIGLSHPLLFKYFASKEELIEAAVQRVFEGRFVGAIRDMQNAPGDNMIERWSEFYSEYFPQLFDRTWIRVFFSVALHEQDITMPYLDRIVLPLVELLAFDTERFALGKTARRNSPTHTLSLELAWALHGSLVYVGIRRWICLLPVGDSNGELIGARVKAHFIGAKEVLKQS
jgi:AcrR family transcriptional regulator